MFSNEAIILYNLYMKNSKILTDEDVKHVAKLANLELTPEEMKKYQKQLTEIINYISKLEKVETDSVEPTSQVTGLDDVNVPDEIISERILTHDEVFQNTKIKAEDKFKVNAIFDNEDL